MTIKERWVSRPWWDLLTALAGLGLYLVGMVDSGFYEMCGGVAGTSGVLLGMASVVYSLFQQSSSERVRMLRIAYRDELRKNWTATLAGFVVVSAVALLAIPAWSLSQEAAKLFLGYSTALLIFRSVRMVWLLRLYLKVDSADAVPSLTLRNDIGRR
mgnify:CR=1 FL=1